MKREDLKRIGPTMVLVLLCYGLFISKYKVVSMDTISQVIFLFTSGLIGYYVVDMYQFLKEKYFRWPTVIWIILITLVSSFLLVGKPLFIWDREFGIKTILLYLLTNIWILPYLLSFIYCLEKKPMINKNQSYQKKHRWILFAIFFIIWEIVLLIFFPGTLTSDSIDQWLQASGVREITQYHPALMTVLMKFTYQIVQNPALFLSLQIAFCSYVLSTFLDYLYKKGLSLKVIYTFTIVFVLLPTNQLLIISLWKDIIYTFALLWMTYFFMLFALDEELFTSKKRHYVYFIVCMILVSLLRYNGVGPLLFAIIYLLYLTFRRKQRRYLILNVTMVASIIFVNGPFLKWCGTTSEGQISTTSYSPITNLVTRSTARAALEHRKIPAFTKKVVEAYGSMELLTENYNPYNVDTFGFNEEIHEYQEKLKDKATISNADAIKAYLLLFFSAPDQVILERLDGMDLIWNMTPLDSFNHRYGYGIWLPANLTKEEEKELKKINQEINRNQESYVKDEGIAQTIQKTAEKMGSFYIIDNIASRCGLYIIILMLLLLYTWKHNKSLFAVYIPILANTATWVLLFAYQVYRYVWYLPIITIFMFFVVCCFTQNTEKKTEKKKSRKKKTKKVMQNEK